MLNRIAEVAGHVEPHEKRQLDEGDTMYWEALNEFFQKAEWALNGLDFFLGPVKYSVQPREYHDLNGLAEDHKIVFVCLRREAHKYGFFLDKAYKVSLDLSHVSGSGTTPLVFAVHARTDEHYSGIVGALQTLADTLSEETGRRVTFRHERHVPGLLDC
jgi:hypothetical protein